MNFVCICVAMAEATSVCFICPSVKAASFSMLKAFFPRMGTAYIDEV